jgi:sialate O-acetylesterase
MKTIRVIKIVIFLLSLSLHAQKIKVACIGNSVTFGAGIKERSLNSYPAQLQKLLGSDYHVENFGHSGATALKNGHKPYYLKKEYRESLSFQPNIVIIHLGLNDQGMNNWPKHKDDFVDDYLDLIHTYQSLSSNPRVIICKMTPTFSGHHWFEEGMRESFKEVQAKIEKVAELADLDLINLHEPLYRFPEFFPDNIHPTKEGAALIAQKVKSAITGEYGGLKLPLLYGENMVFQRNQPIRISGLANAEDRIKIEFNNETRITQVASNGKWEITFQAMKAGGPHVLDIKTEFSGNISIKEVFIGEVWLASGQSNMAFETNRIAHAASILSDSILSGVHLFSFEGKAWPGGGAFDKNKLQQCNATSYFKTSGWQKANSEQVANFSGIAYSFAFHLQKKLKVPIGIIDNSVGGSPTQSWISRESMEMEHETVDLLNDVNYHPKVDPWVNQRKAENFEHLDQYGVKARHPFDPTLLFDAGIEPIKNHAIKGVIWYQGESNAENIKFHELLFPMLVSDWRRHWSHPKMPFYFVQLSSLNRPTWGHFRDSQRKLQSQIPHTGMAVSSDVGNSTDVHPKRKWILGQRLSRIALAKTYQKDLSYSGPQLDYVNVEEANLEVHFSGVKTLKTSDGEEIKDLQIAGANGVFVDAEGQIIGNMLRVWSDDIINPRFVRYGYSPYSDGNLVNEAGLPSSTFSNYSNN